MGTALEVVDAFGSRWAAHDLDGSLDLLTADCVFDSTGPAPDGTRCVGTEAIREAWAPIFENVASVFTVERTIDAGDHIVQLWHYSWGDGHVRGIDVFRVEGGKIAEKLSYVKG
ncbi:MAG: nuclear transport factor 2 family protein [Acidimicrobiia bacterium]